MGCLGNPHNKIFLKIMKNNNKSSSAEILQQDGDCSNSIQQWFWIMSGIATEQLPWYLQSSKAHLKGKKKSEHDLVAYSLNMTICLQKLFVSSKAPSKQSWAIVQTQITDATLHCYGFKTLKEKEFQQDDYFSQADSLCITYRQLL